jgi:hypothetical protein
MNKMSKKEEKALKKVIESKVFEKYNSDIDDNNLYQDLHDDVVSVFEESDVPFEVVIPNLQLILQRICFIKVCDELGVEIEELYKNKLPYAGTGK